MRHQSDKQQFVAYQHRMAGLRRTIGTRMAEHLHNLTCLRTSTRHHRLTIVVGPGVYGTETGEAGVVWLTSVLQALGVCGVLVLYGCRRSCLT